MRVAQVCPYCNGTVQTNLHAQEKYLLTVDALLTLVFFSAAFAFESEVLLIVAIVVSTVPYIALQYGLPRRLAGWTRYKKVEKRPNPTIETDARKNSARRSL